MVKNSKIIPGDMVSFELKEGEKDAVITEILPRKNELIRPAIANVDQLVFIFAFHSPEPDLLMLDKLLLMTSLQDIPTIVCFNKIDLDKEGKLNSFRRQYSNCGCHIMALEAKEEIGIAELREKLYGKTSVLAGQSGVGKTTIINKLFNNNYRTNTVSEKTKRGRHTTTHVEFIRVDDDTFIGDTPGFSLVDSLLISGGRTDSFYPEFEKHIDKCRFKGCIHVNEPSCGVKGAVSDGEIAPERYSRYVTLLGQIKESQKSQRGW